MFVVTELLECWRDGSGTTVFEATAMDVSDDQNVDALPDEALEVCGTPDVVMDSVDGRLTIVELSA